MSIQLTIFADSFCPLCMKEMARLAELDNKGQLAFVDIHKPDQLSLYDDIDVVAANKVLHGYLPSGQVLLGLDVTHKAWQLVGKGYLTGWIRLPGFAALADAVYLLFARNRYRISYLLTGRSRCGDHCQLNDADKTLYAAVFGPAGDKL